MIGSATGLRIGITGLGTNVPAKVMTNDDMAQFVDTSDEWIQERTGIRERRIAVQEEALSDIALPAVREALAEAGADVSEIDLVICATVTPDMLFPTTSALMADTLGMRKAAAYDLLAGCTGFMYAVAQAYGMLASGLSKKAVVVGGDLLSKILDWDDRSTLVIFGDGAGAVVMEPVDEGRFPGLRARRGRRRRRPPLLPGQRLAPLRRSPLDSQDERPRSVQVRDPRDGLVGRGGARAVRQDDRRHRRLRATPGEQADNRLCGR